MKIIFIPKYDSERTSERTPQIIGILGRRHELVFLDPRERLIKKRAFWPLRAMERLSVTRSLVAQGKKIEGADLIFCRDYMHALPGSFIAGHLKIPCVWDSEGSMKAFWETSHKYATQVLPWMYLEKWLVGRVDYMITVTERDKRAYVEQGMDPARIHIIPICISPEYYSAKTKMEARRSLNLPPEEKLFLFFSMFNYLPNRAALDFLNRDVAPLLPGRLLLCGKGNLPQKLHPKIDYLGFLPMEKLYDLIRASDVCLAPIWEANGTLTKVLDMLAHGAPTVITEVVRMGIPEIQDGVHALVAKTKSEFIEKALNLAKDPDLQQKLKRSAPDIIHQKYEWQLYEDKLLGLIEGFKKKNV